MTTTTARPASPASSATRIHADHTVCEGIGMCEATADDYFEVGDDGFVQVLDDSPEEAERTYVKAAVDACPVSALRLEG